MGSQQTKIDRKSLRRTTSIARAVTATVVFSLLLVGCGVGSLVGNGSNSATQFADTSATSTEISKVLATALPAIAKRFAMVARRCLPMPTTRWATRRLCNSRR